MTHGDLNPASRLARTTSKVIALSRVQRSDSHGAVDWAAPLATDRLAMSEALLPLAGLAVYRGLSDEQRWRLALLEAASFFSINIAGERELMSGLALRLYKDRPASVSRYLQHFLEEENAHTAVFARFCLDYCGGIFPDRQVHLPRDYARGEEEFLFFARVLVFEEIAHYYNKSIPADSDVWPLARDINRYHAEDENRHIAFGRVQLEELWERLGANWSDGEKNRIAAYLERYVEMVARSYVNPAVYRAIGLPDGIRRDILASSHWASLSGVATARIRRWLARIGAAGHV